MAEFTYDTRKKIEGRLDEDLKRRMQKLSGRDKDLAQAVVRQYPANGAGRDYMKRIQGQFYAEKEKKPSEWVLEKGRAPGERAHQDLLDAFVPPKFQGSYLYIIDKLNQFPFSDGWYRRTVRTAGYGPSVHRMFSLLLAYEKLYYCGDNLEDFIYRRMDAEKLDFINHEWNFTTDFNYIYAAEIDKGNQAVIDALKNLMGSGNGTAYLDREMILGIIRSSNSELHRLLGGLLLAARLQEGLRQVICEAMDEGTQEAFLVLLDVIEKNDLIRYSSVKRAVSTWIGIFNEQSVDRVSGKLLNLMGRCLRDYDFCMAQLKTEDSVAISAALWALGFQEADMAVDAMMGLIGNGTKNQKLTASYYNQNLYSSMLKRKAAKKAVLGHADDLELVAAFMPAFTSNLQENVQGLLYHDTGRMQKISKPSKPVLADYFDDEEDAKGQYEKLWDIYMRLPKKGVVYDPCIFPWHRVELKPSDVICQLAFTAYVLEDEQKITEMAALLGEISVGVYGCSRARMLNLLLYNPVNEAQRKLLIGYMGNAEEDTSSQAIELVKQLSFEKDDFRLMEDMLRFKRSKLRGQLLGFLIKQDDPCMEGCLERLLADKKEEKRSAGLDLLMRLSKDEKRAGFYQRVKTLAASIASPTDKEKVMIEEILGGKEDGMQNQKGFGVYDPDAPEQIPELSGTQEGKEAVQRCIRLREDEAIQIMKRLDAWVKENREYEYETSYGEKELLGNDYRIMKMESAPESNRTRYRLSNYPLGDKLRSFYEKEIGDYGVLVELEARLLIRNEELYHNSGAFYKAVFGKMPFQLRPLALEYDKQVQAIRLNYRYEFLDRKLLLKAGIEAIRALGKEISMENKSVAYHYKNWNGVAQESYVPVNNIRFLDRFFEGLGYWETDEEFKQAFYVAWAFELKCSEPRKSGRFLPKERQYYGYSTRALTPITPYWFLKAYHMGLINWDILCKAVFEYFNRRDSLRALTQLVKGEYAKPSNRSLWNQFFGQSMAEDVLSQAEAAVGEDTWCGKIVRELYDAAVSVMVDTELRRGEAPTQFSDDIWGITYIEGIGYLVRILMALGTDTLGREAYYSWYYSNVNTKKEVLSSLLKACYPAAGDNGKALASALAGTSIQPQRLAEAAMYAPQWIDIIQECLGVDGLKSGCYYFMAHMDESFDSQKEAMIARFTPLSTEELQGGAFDIDWFQEVYGMLGEKNFGMLYKAAKYISDGQKHSRARKYADAASGKISLEQLREQITAKRNKDLLMSYGLVPFREGWEKDVLERYQFIQKFAKEAKQFGAQRRASESKAAQTALVNLSVHAGFSDVMRLVLNMEGKLAGEFENLMEWADVDDVEICLHVDEEGKSGILCRKGGKELKSVPSRLKKNAYVLELKEAHKKLKEQYSRAKQLMEESMESGAEFTAAEVAGLLGNPVVRGILKPLVFISGEITGFPISQAASQDGDGIQEPGQGVILQAWDGTCVGLGNSEKLRIAHCLDLYKAGIWHAYQKCLFDKQMRQPFKQVFRELYVKLPEELEQEASRMFAGNQIQPQKTVACLKGRRWIADYDEGLQKVYYKENIIARIYALADWFSPSDIEAPALEWVEFSDRKTFKALKIKQVPDLVYSEVMRDVDLAVSVAHAGGVDPQASHSTIEMRRAIAAFNVSLFQLANVTLKDSHAIIKGTRGTYNVHLGSGVVHQEGGAMINILPVHSQGRGRLFLPFVDEDPKTAEIMSKIVLLAEDSKIRDPFILKQII